MNQTLKGMLRLVACDHSTAWDLYVDLLLFAFWETPQTSTGFTPFKLVYGWIPWGIWGLVDEQWSRDPPNQDMPSPQYLRDLQDWLETAHRQAASNLGAQRGKKAHYEGRTKTHYFRDSCDTGALCAHRKNKGPRHREG